MVMMSQKEFQRVKVIENAAGGRLSVREASRLLHLSERQVQRLKRRYQPDSSSWVQHGNRGRSMPWAVPLPQKQLILTLARGKYQGFNDSHLTEKLAPRKASPLSRETVRRILRAAKLASPQKRRPRQYRSRRPPRPRFGMMALTDASRHDWLEGRGPTLTLIGFQDDATGQILAAHFQLEAENTLGYLRALHAMIATHGIPLSLYRDRHSIFQRNDAHWTLAEQLAGKQSPTQLGRTLEELGIESDPRLLSPSQRPHRARLAHLARTAWSANSASPKPSTLAQANAVLARFCADYNQRFARPAADAASDFRPCRAALISPAASACTINAWSLPITPSPWRAHSIALPPLPGHRGYAGETVELSHQLDGMLSVYRGDRSCSACPCRSKNTPRAALRVPHLAQKRKTPMPRIYNLSGRPALAAVT
jgi:transposase